jgi:2,3-bisphosphoglycerate-dependent phosphoglycerate mutase
VEPSPSIGAMSDAPTGSDLDAPAPVPGEVRQFRFVRPPGATSILLVRHGESAPARPDVPFALVDGQGDPELSPLGREQADRIADRLSGDPTGEPIGTIVISNLRRTAETAGPLAARLGLIPEVEKDVREVHLGEWEGGLFRIRVAEGHPIAERMRTEERWDVIPGAEPADGFAARVRDAIARIAAKHPDETVAVFTHGGVIARVLAEASGSRPFAFNGADNGSISLVVVDGPRWVVRAFNDTAHLHRGFGVRSEALT